MKMFDLLSVCTCTGQDRSELVFFWMQHKLARCQEQRRQAGGGGGRRRKAPTSFSPSATVLFADSMVLETPPTPERVYSLPKYTKAAPPLPKQDQTTRAPAWSSHHTLQSNQPSSSLFSKTSNHSFPVPLWLCIIIIKHFHGYVHYTK